MALKKAVKEIKDSMEDFDFPSLDDIEIVTEPKVVISIYGDKNDAKSTSMFSLMERGDSCIVFSFDGKSGTPLDLPFIKNMKLSSKVVNPTVFYNKSTDSQWLSSAVKTTAFLNKLLDDIEPESYDWICLDCTEIFKEIAEMTMRAKYKCGVFSGVNMAYWKERSRIIDNIHDRAFKLAKKGVIYTFYPKTTQMLVKDGQTVDSKQVPNWIGNILRNTDVVIHAATFKDKSGKWRYMANIEGSKNVFFREGEYDVTNKCLRDVLNVVNGIQESK